MREAEKQLTYHTIHGSDNYSIRHSPVVIIRIELSLRMDAWCCKQLGMYMVRTIPVLFRCLRRGMVLNNAIILS
jgi:hypothetical protein